MGWSEKLEKIELFCLVVFLPVDKKKGEKPKDTLIVFKNGETFEKIGTKSFLQMGHIEVQIKGNEATLRLPTENVSLDGIWITILSPVLATFGQKKTVSLL